VRVVTTPFSLESQSDRTRALEQIQPTARGRWLIILDSYVNVDRFGIETALEFAGSNEISALALRAGLHCRSLLQRVIAPSMEQLLQMVRIANRRRERRHKSDVESPFLLVNREAFEAVSRNNRMPGILNEAAWNVWGYQLEGLRTFEGDGSRWLWRDADVRSWSSDSDPERRYTSRSASFVIGSMVMAFVAVAGLVFGFTHRLDNFAGASILAFSAVNYSLMAVSYFLFARRLRAAVWFAPLWFLGHVPGEFSRCSKCGARRAGP